MNLGLFGIGYRARRGWQCGAASTMDDSATIWVDKIIRNTNTNTKYTGNTNTNTNTKQDRAHQQQLLQQACCPNDRSAMIDSA
jgi:hypothetical protein